MTVVDDRVGDLERENAELRRRLDEALAQQNEALAQQAATIEVLEVINSPPGNLAPVFDAILEKAMRLCEAAYGFLAIFEGPNYRLVATRNLPEALAEVGQGVIPVRPGTAFARIAGGEPFVYIPDAASSETYRMGNPRRRALVDLGGARTYILVALRKNEVPLGVFAIYRQEVRPFTDKQITLLQNFAAQAVIAMENARLITETREALEQQTATAEVLQVINSSPGDLAPVFDAMLEKAMRLCEAAFGVLWTFEGELGHAVALGGVPPAFAEFLTRGPHRETSGNANSRLRRGEPALQIADIADDDAYRSGDPVRRALVELGGGRTMLAVPLRKDDALLGSFIIYRQEVRPFTDKQIALLQNFAAQAVIAMENARLITETREALEQQTATAEVLQVINASPGNLGPVLYAMLEKAMRLCGAVHGSLTEYNGELFRCVASHNLPEALFELLSQPRRAAPNSPQERLLQGERIVHIADMAEIWVSPDNQLARAAAEIGFTRTVLFVPLRKDNVLLGYITAARREVRPFAEKQIALLQNFAAQAVIAMENARLLTETREALEQQTATAEVLQVINASPGELAPVFDAILEKAHKLCGVSHGSLQLYEDGRIRAVATRGVTEDIAARLRQPREPGLVGERLLAGARFHEIADQGEAVAQSPLPTQSGGIDWRQQGISRRLFVPLRHDTSLLGMIVAGRTEVRPFSDKEILLLENFAQQAVIAMENARLLGELQRRTEEVAELNRGLEAQVAEQVEELGRVGRLKRFLAPPLAELIVSQGDEEILESHRREIVVVFCDLRGYTAFTETAEPEEVLEFLREYHGALGPLVAQFEGTLDQFSGDGIMVFFNDPVPCPDPAERAVKMAMAMREAAGRLIADWRRHSYELGFGVGIAQGYATLGQIGFSERSGYTAIGTVCNLAARLCAEAKDGQILVSSRIAGAVEAVARLEDLGNLELKGLRRPVAAFNVTELINEAPP